MSKHSLPTVLQVLHTLNVGGAEVLAARLARRLREQFRFVFACLDAEGSMAPELRAEGFPVEVLHRQAGFDWRCVRRLARVAHSYHAAVIQAHQYTPFFYSRAPGWLGRRAPVLFTEHGRHFPDLPSRKRMVFNRTFLRPCDRVVAVGEAVRQALVKNEGIAAERIDVIYNGVRLADFRSENHSRQHLRQALGIAADTPVAIQVARLDPLKDHATALRAAACIRRQLPQFKLLLVGEGPERAAIEQNISRLELHDTVQLLGLRTDVRELLAVADLFLLTSISEGIPVTLIEAMAAQLPVVSTDVGGTGEVVVPGVTGYLAPAGDDAALAARMLELLTHPDRASAMGRQGRTRAETEFSEHAMHTAYAQLLKQMAGVPACS
jgi:glycosyltransferase involved in cell wall biosynthesis